MKNADKTHCIHGHELAGANLYVTTKGYRQCKACQEVMWRSYNARVSARRQAAMIPPEVTRQQRFWLRVRKGVGCWLWSGATSGTGIQARGYIKFGQRRRVFVHRYSYELHHGPIPEGGLVLHRCGNGLCIHPDHLYIGTHQDNSDDRERHGTATRGEHHATAKLTSNNVLEIRTLLAAGHHATKLAVRFGVSSSTIYAIKRGVTWGHLASPREALR